MGLEVIGAGFGRTGTESMKQALEILGLGPCHHMKEVLGNSRQTKLWRSVAGGETADWEEIFDGYKSAIDWPSAFYWRELASHYPDAKVLLTLRSAESWYASMTSTIFKVLETGSDPESLGVKLIGQQVFDGRYDDPGHAMAVFERNTAAVQGAFSEERLLTYHLGDGWEPLCRFLGRPVPDRPYPRSNSAEEFQAFMTQIDRAEGP